MTTMTPTSAWTRLNKVGLGLTIFYGITNLPTVLVPTGPGEDGPPIEISALDSILAAVAIVAGVIAWRKVSRRAARLAARSWRFVIAWSVAVSGRRIAVLPSAP